MTSKKFTLISEDWKKIIKNFLMFSIPMFVLAFLTAIQQGMSPLNALKTASSVLLGVVIDLIKKYVSSTRY